MELVNRESVSSWRDVPPGLKQRGLHGVGLVVSDDHPGPKLAICKVVASSCPETPSMTIASVSMRRTWNGIRALRSQGTQRCSDMLSSADADQ